MPILAALAFVALLGTLFYEYSSRLRPPPSGNPPPAWSDPGSPGAPVEADESARSTFARSSFPSWLWKLGRFELRVSLSADQVVKLLKEHLRPEPGYAFFLPIGGRAVGWVQGDRFQISLIGDLSRHPSSWIADGAIAPAGGGTILRSDFVLRKSRLLTLALVAVLILSGALYSKLTGSNRPSGAASQYVGLHRRARMVESPAVGTAIRARMVAIRRLAAVLRSRLNSARDVATVAAHRGRIFRAP